MSKNKRNKKRYAKRQKTGLPFFQKFILIMLTFVGTLTLLAGSIDGDIPILTLNSSRQSDNDREAFIEKVASYAVPLQDSHGIWPSVTIAQAILESNWGESGLAVNESNYFGIKGSSYQPSYSTLEYEEGWVEIQASFRSYGSMEESVKDYANLIANGTQWNADLYQPVIEADNYRQAAKALQTSGYATDPTYPEKLIDLIERYDLDRFDD
ncbi:N-acetylmuramoyl-L-alanine amidase [Alkalibacterium sp. AK22]|uniref:glycoside hydrolase family 73 protein n=1 Tax=Alkalibacterium sp. AK22 TaxID=1229520 RepID=UPI000452380D|nr:glycoside hydrolase family 73 protein [Alkalibacterium sp. AK22]EXJ23000.1 N-acetylmuramoyl-L-alanine amidase [Alkalibacterium sp. AK22]